MAEKQGIPLTSLPNFPQTALDRLGELWITTAEELVAAASGANGMQGLAEYVGVSEAEMQALVAQAEAVLPVSFATEPEEIDIRGLGALDEPEEGPEPDEGAVPFAPLPPRVDLRPAAPVRDQGYRGTCVAFACTAVREALLGEAAPAEKDLSEQFLYYQCKLRDHYPGSGTFVAIAMRVLRDEGICPETAWPYSANSIPRNEGQGPLPAEAEGQAALYRTQGAIQIPSRWVLFLRWRLSEGRPVAFAVPVYTYWFTRPWRDSGDIRLPLPTDKKEGGHAMCMVGYEDDEAVPGGGYFLVRNSWGTDWAQNSAVAPGYCRIPYAYITRYGMTAYTATVAPPRKPGKGTGRRK
jgi:hypothetical protein